MPIFELKQDNQPRIPLNLVKSHPEDKEDTIRLKSWSGKVLLGEKKDMRVVMDQRHELEIVSLDGPDVVVKEP